jgi:hypothetical protein
MGKRTFQSRLQTNVLHLASGGEQTVLCSVSSLPLAPVADANAPSRSPLLLETTLRFRQPMVDELRLTLPDLVLVQALPDRVVGDANYCMWISGMTSCNR